jgi:hypothetical protein
MYESLTTLPWNSFVDEEMIPERRCAFHKAEPQIDLHALKDLRGFQFDEHDRLVETVSKSGFRTQFFYRDNTSKELRAYQIFDPNMIIFERALRSPNGSWVIDRLNPAQGKMQLVVNSFCHLTLDRAGNVKRVDKHGKVHVLNTRIETQTMMSNLLGLALQA